jgi:hypothetical protein
MALIYFLLSSFGESLFLTFLPEPKFHKKSREKLTSKNLLQRFPGMTRKQKMKIKRTWKKMKVMLQFKLFTNPLYLQSFPLQVETIQF